MLVIMMMVRMLVMLMTMMEMMMVREMLMMMGLPERSKAALIGIRADLIGPTHEHLRAVILRIYYSPPWH